MDLPAAYQWVQESVTRAGGHPRLVVEALKEYGVKEGAGSKDNPTIIAWAREAGIPNYLHDEEAWCGLFMALIIKRADKGPIVSQPLWALNWLGYGERIATTAGAIFGDVLVFERRNAVGTVIGGHVGLYIGEDRVAFHVLGGNTSDSVSIARIDKRRLKGICRPPYRTGIPSNCHPVLLAPEGALSTNEQ
jgi:uncharacterized protein (TIGR02594 family)